MKLTLHNLSSEDIDSIILFLDTAVIDAEPISIEADK